MMACRGLYIFSHESSLGNAPAHTLLERVNVARRAEVVTPRAFSDYTVSVDQQSLPAGITLTKLVEG
jgi:CRISPR-associated protein Csd2